MPGSLILLAGLAACAPVGQETSSDDGGSALPVSPAADSDADGDGDVDLSDPPSIVAWSGQSVVHFGMGSDSSALVLNGVSWAWSTLGDIDGEPGAEIVTARYDRSDEDLVNVEGRPPRSGLRGGREHRLPAVDRRCRSRRPGGRGGPGLGHRPRLWRRGPGDRHQRRRDTARGHRPGPGRTGGAAGHQSSCP